MSLCPTKIKGLILSFKTFSKIYKTTPRLLRVFAELVSSHFGSKAKYEKTYIELFDNEQ